MIHAGNLKAVIDLRSLPAEEGHRLIDSAFDSLRIGESFLLVSDHDPRPVYYHLAHEREGQFSWVYMECGPSIWQVMITNIHFDFQEGA
jgi:uncharacterized protein (DUF2249 family)